MEKINIQSKEETIGSVASDGLTSIYKDGLTRYNAKTVQISLVEKNPFKLTWR